MIPQRFTIPFVVAAVIHAALFAIFPEGRMDSPIAPPTMVSKVVFPPLPPEFFEPPKESEGAGESKAAGRPVPQVRPVLAPPPAVTDFQVPVAPVVAERPDVIIGPIPVGQTNFDGTGTGTGLTEGVFPAGHLDREPQARVRVPPDYPYEAKREGIEGEVEVRFVVGPDGVVQGAHAVRSSHRSLEAAAIRAVLRWKFEPGRFRGRAVSFRMSVPIVFRLGEDR